MKKAFVFLSILISITIYNCVSEQEAVSNFDSEVTYLILIPGGDYAFDVEGGHLVPGANIQLYPLHYQDNQLFKIINIKDDLYQITTLDEKYAFEIEGGNIFEGANLHINPRQGGRNQLFILTQRRRVIQAKCALDNIPTIQ